MAKALDFSEVLELINHSRSTYIKPIPTESEKGKWALFEGENKVPNFRYPFLILYLYSDFTKESAIRAAKAIKIPKATQIIYAPSVKDTLVDELKSKITKPKELAGVIDLKTYLFSFIQDQLQTYTKKIESELEPKYYIEPAYETPSGFKRKNPNPVLSFLTDTVEDVCEGAIALLLAEPGQGKTYTTRYLATELSKKNLITIYINSPQWFNMKDEDLSSLYKTIISSFRYFDTPIDWIEGIEDLFINITLRLGLFRIIFDGFDEYILWNKGRVTPNDVIENLHSLAEQSNSRILITSRTTFWNSSLINETELPKLFKYKILPFDSNHAANYFEKRLAGKVKSIEKAKKIFNEINKLGNSEFSSSFAGRGIILSLIADLSDEDEALTYNGESSIFQWIMLALCLREEKRQKLPIKANEQIEIFRYFAEHRLTGNIASSEILKDIIKIVCENITENELNSLVGKKDSPKSLHDHPLINYNADGWKFRHEQIEFNLLAELIIDYSTKNSNSSLETLFSKLNINGSILDDMCSVIFEQININSSIDKIKTKKFLNALFSCFSSSFSNPRQPSTLILFTTKLIIYILNKYTPSGNPRKERSEELLVLLDSNIIKQLQFTGAINSFDFSGLEFINCRFDNVIWSTCKFNEKTIFSHCHFIGGNIYNCTDFGIADFDNCSFDIEAESIFSNEKIKHSKNKITRKDIERDVELFIKRFMPKEGIFKSISEDNILRGTFATLTYKDTLLDAMKKHIIEVHPLSHGAGKAYNIKNEAKESIRHYLSNNIFSENLASCVNDLCKKLKAS